MIRTVNYHSQIPDGALAKITAWLLMSGVKPPFSGGEYLRMIDDGEKWIVGAFIIVYNKATVICPMHRDIRDLPFIIGKATHVIDVSHINAEYSWALMHKLVPLDRIINKDRGIV